MQNHMTTTTAAAADPARLARLVALSGVAALGLGALLAAPAWAHDELLSSTPSDGEVLTEAPEEVTLEFTGGGLTTGEGITNEIWVTDSEGETWHSDTEVSGATMSTSLQEDMPSGEYDVVYRVVYSDGHDEEGELSFTLDLAEEPAGQDADQSSEQNPGQPAEQNAEAAAEDALTQEDGEQPADADPAVQEGTFPAWAGWLLGIGAVGVTAVAMLLARRKINESERWKDDRDNP